MIIKYLGFLLGLIWSYSFIRTQSIFSKKTAILFKVFISKVSWITFVLACYFGYKNFSFSNFIRIRYIYHYSSFNVLFFKKIFRKQVWCRDVRKIKDYFRIFSYFFYFIFYYFLGLNSKQRPLLQNLFPVGLGPSSNKCP